MLSGILETVTLEKAVAIATPAAKKFFSVKIQPLLTSKINEYFKNKAALKKFEDSTVDYLARLKGQCSIMNTIAFQNAPKKLEDLYVPLTVIHKNQQTKITITDNIDIFKLTPHILISDSAGMGKSTLSKKIVINTLISEEYLPAYIELRKLTNTPLEEQIKLQLGIPKEIDNSILHKLPLAYILDGLDEIPNDLKKTAVDLLKVFVKEFNSSKILITSRHETFLSEFYEFEHYSIAPLADEEAYVLLQKCDPTGSISAALIDGIKNSKDHSIREFLSTPLYVSLLFCSYRHKTIIPQKKNLFYSQVYEALFESHDLSKEISYTRQKHSGLDSADFHSVLRRLGFWCLKNNGKIEFQKDELDIVITKLLSKMEGIQTSPAKFTKDLTSTVPLFVREGSIIRWSHKSLMEYFAAMCICSDTKGKQGEILLALFNNELRTSYNNVFELCSDIDYTSFRSSITKQVFEEFIAYSSANYQNITNKRIPPELVKLRSSLGFVVNAGFSMHSEQTLGEKNQIWNNKNRPKTVLTFAQKTHSNSKPFIEQFFYKLSITSDMIIHCTVDRRNILSTLKLIQNKKPELFIKINQKNSQKEIDSSSFTTDKFYLVDDNPKSTVNNSKNFSAATTILSFLGRTALDLEKVHQELESINRDKSNGIDELLEGL